MNLKTKASKTLFAIRHNPYTYSGKEPSLNAIFFEVTHRCNLACQMCWYGEGVLNKRDAKDELGYDEIIKFIDTLDTVKFITITGGEPFLKPRLIEILEHLESKGIKVSIATNNTVFSKDMYDRLLKLKNVNLLSISVDGDKETHNKVRMREFAYDKTMEALQYVMDNKPSNYRIQMAFAISSLNYPKIVDVYDIAEQMKVPTMQYTHLSYVEGLMNQYVDLKAAVSLKKVEPKEIVRQLTEVGERSKKSITKARMIPKLRMDEIDKYYNDPAYTLSSTCGQLANGLKVNAFGEIYPCRNIEKPLLGNVRTDDINKVFNDNVIVDFRKNINHNYNGVCNKCCAARR